MCWTFPLDLLLTSLLIYLCYLRLPFLLTALIFFRFQEKRFHNIFVKLWRAKYTFWHYPWGFPLYIIHLRYETWYIVQVHTCSDGTAFWIILKLALSISFILLQLLLYITCCIHEGVIKISFVKKTLTYTAAVDLLQLLSSADSSLII